MRSQLTLLALSLLIALPSCRKSPQQELCSEQGDPCADQCVKIEHFERHSPDVEIHHEDIDSFNLAREKEFEDLDTLDDETNILLIDDIDDIKDASYQFTNIMYEFNKSQARPDQQKAIDKNFETARDAIKRGQTVCLAGHACSSPGSTESRNKVLSLERPQKIKEAWVAKGLPASKVKVVGYGTEQLIVPTGDRAAQAPNRRVETYAIKHA